MCGFVGFISNHLSQPNDHEQNGMTYRTQLITHRGPDDDGFYTDDRVQFGFRRLSIIDLEGGHQPLAYDDGRYFMIYNGEVYNYVELREQLEAEGYEFQTDSDSEVIIASYAAKKEEAVKDLRGMFAFVIWDKVEQTIFAARDPFGIKPFYYMETDEGTFFASEKKSLLAGEANDDLSQAALQYYLTYQFVPEPYTMSKKIHRLEPGHYFTKKADGSMSVHPYWQPEFRAAPKTIDTAKKQIRDAMRDSVSVHMRSDVPVGAFLSSGIDSTAIVALAKELNPNIETFTVGFEREGYSEIDVAKDTAEQLNVNNTHTVITPEAFVNELPKIIWHMDDPVADPAAIPLYFVAKEASKHVKVVLSGEGADELFGGYNIYREPLALNWFKNIPDFGRRLLKETAQRLPETTKGRNYVIRGCTPLEERYIGNAFMFDEQEKQFLYKGFLPQTHFTDVTSNLYERVKDNKDIERMQYVDLHTWLRGDILVKADRMTMAHSLELRVPFLDKPVFDVASSIPEDLKTGNKTTKYALREAMRDIVPDSVLYNKKLGFPVPIRVWLRNELYDWARQVIADSQVDEWINKSYVYKLLEDHRHQKRDNSRKLWTILVFMLWHQMYVEKTIDTRAFQVEMTNSPY
ncbi:asparagine synthase (glutamine-hydrolyzing) [Tuberibacillus sp. Marseille-P3662]|uniref:asparagine synthase (glutamine-hydrolyzing) n=1 Tax=Tuberibacillus sp. Marseille-P3662 TaxID=1965358 RepID=UPI000A1CBBC7|nr:asparagine synthase (glutamine-hydrolyzing) [Tuberibacillus sp. Marseille-P3662]